MNESHSANGDRKIARGGVTILVNRFEADPYLTVLDAPRSGAAEEYRKALVPALGTTDPAAERGAWMVVSPLEGEGKTLTAVNIALASAERREHKVLLVDFDLRRPRVETFLVERGRAGVADILRSQARPVEVIQKCPQEGLYVLTAGRSPASAVDRLDLARATGMLRALRGAFDVIVGDCPPLLPFAETRMLAKIADRVLLVARAERTPRSAVAEALELLDRDRLQGIVLNAMPAHRWQYYGYRYAYQWRENEDGEEAS